MNTSMRAKTAIAIFNLFAILQSFGQDGKPRMEYHQYYPIGDDATLMYKTSYVKSETILFEANPIVRYSFFNNIQGNLLIGKDNAYAFYVAFKPQLRMYTENSLPVKMPSYKIQLGFQWLRRVRGNDFFTIGLESGHYSNGQAMCAFNELIPDGSPQCDSIYSLITPKSNLSDMLNRKSGNYSTNLTELIFNYKFNHFDDQARPDRVHSITLGFNLYHDRFWGLLPFGGYSDADIKIYGWMRYTIGYEYTFLYKATEPKRITASQKFEIIQGAHPWVNPLRSVTSITFFPVGNFQEFGITASFVHGHDDYNYRFVDSGNQFGIGLAWNVFPSFQIMQK